MDVADACVCSVILSVAVWESFWAVEMLTVGCVSPPDTIVVVSAPEIIFIPIFINTTFIADFT